MIERLWPLGGAVLLALAACGGSSETTSTTVPTTTNTTIATTTTTPGPERVLVVGDCVAYTLLPGLRATTDEFEFVTATATGCPLDLDAVEFAVGSESMDLTVPEYCDWRATWPPAVEDIEPSLVVALWGLWDAGDHLVGDDMLLAGTPDWNTHLEATFEEALDTLGVPVVVIATPYVLGLDHARVDALNAVFRTVAARRDDVTVVALEELPERWDGVHLTQAGAARVAADVVPVLQRVATG